MARPVARRGRGNFSRPKWSERTVLALFRYGLRLLAAGLRPRAAAALENGTVLFFGVVLGVALLFRAGLGAARPTEPEAEAGPARSETPERPRARRRAEAGGSATLVAIVRGRARDFAAPARPVVARAPDAPPREVAPPERGPDLRRPSPSFLRAREVFEHRHSEAIDFAPEPRPQKLGRPRPRRAKPR